MSQSVGPVASLHPPTAIRAVDGLQGVKRKRDGDSEGALPNTCLCALPAYPPAILTSDLQPSGPTKELVPFTLSKQVNPVDAPSFVSKRKGPSCDGNFVSFGASGDRN
eukprot:8626182-Pyramimonas_sp.AAC.1